MEQSDIPAYDIRLRTVLASAVFQGVECQIRPSIYGNSSGHSELQQQPGWAVLVVRVFLNCDGLRPGFAQRIFSAPRRFLRHPSLVGHLQGVYGREPLPVQVHGQERVFEGHGAEQGWLSLFAEGDRRGKLLPLQPDGRPSLFPRYPPSVGQEGGVGPGGGYVQRF